MKLLLEPKSRVEPRVDALRNEVRRRMSDEYVSTSPALVRPYDSMELRVDRAVHIGGMILGLAAAGTATVFAVRAETVAESVAILAYALGLLLMLGASAAYHLTPASRLKDNFRRLDHAAIFIMIAGTCSGFTLGRPGVEGSLWLTALAWLLALAGVTLKIVVPRRFEHVALIAYITLGFVSLAALYPLWPTLDTWSVTLLLAGAAIYLGGAAIYVWSTMRFHNAIWHALVVLAAATHFVAIIIARA